jgi:hypothetical protein
VYEYVYEYDSRIGENRSLSYSYTYSYTPISPCQGSSTAVSRLNFIHHRHEAGGIGKRLPFAFTDPVC